MLPIIHAWVREGCQHSVRTLRKKRGAGGVGGVVAARARPPLPYGRGILRRFDVAMSSMCPTPPPKTVRVAALEKPMS